MMTQHVVPRQAAHAFLGSRTCQRHAIRVISAEKYRRQSPERHLQRRHFFVCNGGELELLLPFEVGLRENGIQNNVGEQVQASRQAWPSETKR